ncbi:MAG: Restriction endonuclease [Microgenomates group bacterium GW2011_GWA2_40_6]|nr:MAG: Restriction endonuclease [Microgenomates group bacterium GW2011_GWA2_40_6]
MGHDEPKTSYDFNPKSVSQPRITKYGKLTQNGLFVDAVDQYKQGKRNPELVKVYEKVLPGVWSMKGYFDLLDYKYEDDGKRNIFVFTLRLNNKVEPDNNFQTEIEHNRLIPSEVKKEVWIRDGGKCVLCGLNKNLHFDHDLPFSKGGTSLTAKNVRLLCMKCNLAKSNKIE